LEPVVSVIADFLGMIARRIFKSPLILHTENQGLHYATFENHFGIFSTFFFCVYGVRTAELYGRQIGNHSFPAPDDEDKRLWRSIFTRAIFVRLGAPELLKAKANERCFLSDAV
jgi:hypothetical protein